MNRRILLVAALVAIVVIVSSALWYARTVNQYQLSPAEQAFINRILEPHKGAGPFGVLPISDGLFRDRAGIFFAPDAPAPGTPARTYFLGVLDEPSFGPLGISYTVPSPLPQYATYTLRYFADKTQVFLFQRGVGTSGERAWLEPIAGADPATFVMISATSTADATHQYRAVWTQTATSSRFTVTPI